MHRIASQANDFDEGQFLLIEQPSADVLFLSSATTDITSLYDALRLKKHEHMLGKIRALNLKALEHPSQIDHYISTTASKAKIIIIRILGGKSYWPYGIEQLKIWRRNDKQRKLFILSTTNENKEYNYQLDNDYILTLGISELFNQGGLSNISQVLEIIENILSNKVIDIDNYRPIEIDNPYLWDWKNEKGINIAILHYASHLKANDLNYAKSINKILRSKGFSPKTLFVSSLRDKDIHKKFRYIFKKTKVSAFISTTSFSSINISEIQFNDTIWDYFNLPIFQLLSSTESEKTWNKSQIGLNPIDLTMQVVMPEVDGRIITRPTAFKEIDKLNTYINSPITYLKPNIENLKWIADYVYNWIKLTKISNNKKRITIILANYPIKNSRIANGVGLDTPESLFNILSWLNKNNYNLGDEFNVKDGNEIINKILKSRTNSPESYSNDALDYIPLTNYKSWFDQLPSESRNKVIKRWDQPENSEELEKKGFSINGIRFGNISILIQPARGYDPENLSDLHSPDLPPPHRYLAQYLWVNTISKSNAIIHLGKHGSVEWLPGKGIGLSNMCFPHIALPPLPNIYPFIVNDPGEGSQAKRRTQAVIIDHLTPPLDRAELYGDLQKLEFLLDEYYESNLLKSKRKVILEEKIIKLIKDLSLENIDFNSNNTGINKIIDDVDTYLCEIKDSQIRTGLHIFGSLPKFNKLIELIVSISRSPIFGQPGLTQSIARIIGFSLDPWSDDEYSLCKQTDKDILFRISGVKARRNIDIIDYLENQAKELIYQFLRTEYNLKENLKEYNIRIELNDKLIELLNDKEYHYFKHIDENIIQKLLYSPDSERKSFLDSLNGKRVHAGPSGAPSRGNAEVLPTGKNFFSVDIRSLPTEASWALGKKSCQLIIDNFRLENGEDLRNLAISIWATSTMRNGGEDISQVLSLMGVEPVWDYASKRLIDIDIIPLSILDRPRVDVMVRISGLFRDTFPQLVDLLFSAAKKLSFLNEPEELNPYVVLKKEEKFSSRIFGSAPGAYGAGLQELISNSCWESKNELVDSYLNWSKWSYSSSDCPTDSKSKLIEILRNIQVVLHNQDNKEHDILDSDDYYQFHGGLSAAVEIASGKKPLIYIADHSRSNRPRLNKLEKEIDRVVRSRFLNPKWIEGIKKHGYKGAFEISASLDYLFAYDATTNKVPNWCYGSIFNTFILNNDNLSFLKKNNPWALKDIAERLLEASNRSLWNTNKNTENKLKDLIIQTEADLEK